MDKTAANGKRMARALLEWYAAHARALPWRAPPGARPDPYRVWLSEIMLQQTTVETVRRRFDDFVRRWPDVWALAAAPLEDVLAAWAGLGYYARARNLHKCAQVVAGELNGQFPQTPQELQKLPGIGPYTAGAIAAIAFGYPAVAMDTNAERVIARLFAVADPLPGCKPVLKKLAKEMLPREAPGEFAQALMDLGAMVCTARKPVCGLCPLQEWCSARRQALAEELPRREKRRDKPLRHGLALWIMREDGQVLLRRRAARGMLGGMVELPSAGWDGQPDAFDMQAPFGLPAEAFEEAGEVRHTFTHFHLRLRLRRLRWPLSMAEAASLPCSQECFWHPAAQLDKVGLPTLFAKAWQLLRVSR